MNFSEGIIFEVIQAFSYTRTPVCSFGCSSCNGWRGETLYISPYEY